jgi:hypothetical protein
MAPAMSLDDFPALRWIHDQLYGTTRAAFLRTPVRDPQCRAHFDLDLMVFGPVEGFLPERVHAPDGTPVDLAWYPQGLLSAPEVLARSGLAAHRMKSSTLVWDRMGDAAAQRGRFDLCMAQPEVQAERIGVFLDMARLTVREIGVTWDFPSLALFWLQMSHAACVAALADAAGLACPNVYTRPFAHLAEVERLEGLTLQPAMRRTLRLDADVGACVDALRRMHAAVWAGFAEPAWPAGMRQATRAEYAYSLSPSELAWRIGVAQGMARNGQAHAAVYYLRFWGYTVARLPMVWQCAADGRDIAFLRPEQAMRPALQRICPHILHDFDTLLGGPLRVDEIVQGLHDLNALRRILSDLVRVRGIPIAQTPEWQPFQAPDRNEPTQRRTPWPRCPSSALPAVPPSTPSSTPPPAAAAASR